MFRSWAPRPVINLNTKNIHLVVTDVNVTSHRKILKIGTLELNTVTVLSIVLLPLQCSNACLKDADRMAKNENPNQYFGSRHTWSELMLSSNRSNT